MDQDDQIAIASDIFGSEEKSSVFAETRIKLNRAISQDI
jgi:hypothetical protein